jgi:hypothetical protein
MCERRYSVMAGQEHHKPWWERPAMTPGQPQYEPQREHLRAELARAWRADPAMHMLQPDHGWGASDAPRAA